MVRYIVTGAPGAGKTAIIRQLELDGFGVVEEAATDVIAAAQARGTSEPWTDPAFIDAIVSLQRERQLRASQLPDDIQFHDRSPVCTAALADYLGHPRTSVLTRELSRLATERTFDHRVFMIRMLGFVTPTDARRITYEEALDFERVHERVYREFGYELVSIEAGHLLERVARIKGIACPSSWRARSVSG